MPAGGPISGEGRVFGGGDACGDLVCGPLAGVPEGWHEGVGANLHDHLQIRAVFRLREGTDTLNARARTLAGRARIALKTLSTRLGP